MAEDKKTILLYTEIKATVETLQDDEAGLLFKNILRFVTGEEVDETNRFTNIAFGLIKEQLVRSMDNYDRALKKKSEGGRKGNIKRWYPDLYKKVEEGTLTIDEAESIAEQRKKSHTEAYQSDSESNQSDAIGQVAYPYPIPIPIPNPLPIKVDSSVEVSKTSPPPTSKKFDFKKALIEYGLNENLATEYMKVRKDKKASNTQTALNAILKEVEISGRHIDECIEICIVNSWKGFKAEWINNQSKTFSNGKSNTTLSANERHELAKAELARRDEERFSLFGEQAAKL